MLPVITCCLAMSVGLVYGMLCAAKNFNSNSSIKN